MAMANQLSTAVQKTQDNAGISHSSGAILHRTGLLNQPQLRCIERTALQNPVSNESRIDT